ncbi:glycosyltransferase [Asticcacaulis sp. ZE23SCel15]|uniref:glycosyltransferase n=1 Tax=Asticcacaulis sp. ZE23SCel15 TaxID=3059027 RepID=UPI00265FFD9D|nr:nucleotide disphospho-sugar-binding domain-containing protein [Asticcacaulis sp. ZE23SCel15]WKL56887.1 glycosyltransferase [Asticcacaulis sp. ZE23SCel15]
MKIVLATHGSLGDLHPFMALGLALKAQGAEVVLASHPDYRQKVEAAGLTFYDYGASRETYTRDLRMAPEAIIHRLTRDHSFMIKRLIAPYLETAVADLRPLLADADVMVGSSFAYGAHIAAQLEQKPFTVIALQPTVMMSVYDPPKVKKAPFIFNPTQNWQRHYNRLIIRAGEGFMASTQSSIRRIYKKFGLEPHISLGGILSDHQTLALYDPLFGQIEPDFPPNTQICGFPFYDSEDGRAPLLTPDLKVFLENGPPPLVFGLGSAVVTGGGAFYRIAIEVTRHLNARAVLLVGADSPLLREDHGPDILAISYSPHSLLFPRCRAIIHHGGIGSTAQALRSGRPQLVVPVFADQFDNARRVTRLGAGKRLNYDQWMLPKAITALTPVLDDPDITIHAQEARLSLSRYDGSTTAAALILTPTH